MSCLLIDNGARERLAVLRQYAEDHPIPAPQMHLIAGGRIRPCGDNPAYILDLPENYRIVLTVEEHPQPGGGVAWLRHLSVSLAGVRKGRVPPLPAMRAILPLAGFWQDLEDCKVWTEDFGPGVAVNVAGLLNRPTPLEEDRP